MGKVAFLTYNTVGDGMANGWHEGPSGRCAYVLQNSMCNRFAVDQLLDGAVVPPPGYDRREEKYVNRVRDEIGTLWGKLQEVVCELDHVVVYVGSKGSERAIALAAQLPAAKVMFVGCDCGLSIKTALVMAAGMTDARMILCECGGRRTMQALFEHFMETGELVPTPAHV